MTCPSCVDHVAEALSIVGVAHVEVKREAGSVEVDHEAGVSQGRLIAALRQAGYEATPEARPAESGGARKLTCCGSC